MLALRQVAGREVSLQEVGLERLAGVMASKSASAAQGDEVYAESLGRFRISEVEGETHKRNLKVRLEVERV